MCALENSTRMRNPRQPTRDCTKLHLDMTPCEKHPIVRRGVTRKTASEMAKTTSEIDWKKALRSSACWT